MIMIDSKMILNDYELFVMEKVFIQFSSMKPGNGEANIFHSLSSDFNFSYKVNNFCYR